MCFLVCDNSATSLFLGLFMFGIWYKKLNGRGQHETSSPVSEAARLQEHAGKKTNNVWKTHSKAHGKFWELSLHFQFSPIPTTLNLNTPAWEGGNTGSIRTTSWYECVIYFMTELPKTTFALNTCWNQFFPQVLFPVHLACATNAFWVLEYRVCHKFDGCFDWDVSQLCFDPSLETFLRREHWVGQKQHVVFSHQSASFCFPLHGLPAILHMTIGQMKQINKNNCFIAIHIQSNTCKYTCYAIQFGIARVKKKHIFHCKSHQPF